MGAFATYQPLYAAHRVATFPVTVANDDKKPSTRGYLKTGLRGSAQLVIKFPDAESFGFGCGPRSRITVIDMDDTDQRIVAEGERLFGRSPLLWRTGGGKFAMAFRYAGEPRRIRAIPGLPIDLLGGGFVVAPGSAGIKRPYEIIRGSLDDLDRLPVARMPRELAPQPPREIPEGKRNTALFQYGRSVVGYCDDEDQLVDAAATWASNALATPLSSAEIRKTCHSVWQYQGGRKRLFHRMLSPEQSVALAAQPDVLGVFAFLLMENGPAAEFLFADGLATARGWPRRLVPTARDLMLQLGVIEPVGRKGKVGPFLYRWATPPL
ncbi:MAG TPA: primase C-terminal domain-containing protein [Stellaceae bacterium]|nr:primase C-terminal domain-containing protein [Stellaceae bacterium]